jgi:hypothetical protein
MENRALLGTYKETTNYAFLTFGLFIYTPLFEELEFTMPVSFNPN